MRKKFITFAITALILTVLASCSNGRGSGYETEASHDYPPSESAGGAPLPGANIDPGELITREELLPSSEVISITSFDGYNIQGRLTLPGSERIETLVIFVNATGPQTFDTRRNFGDELGFVNFNDLYATRFQERNIAFFSYNTRGVSIGGEFPLFFTVNDTQFLTHLPANQVRDIYYMINAIRAMDARLENSHIILWGHSEGTIISTIFAELYPHMVDALILISTYVDNMYDVLMWELTGGGWMVWGRDNFDTDNYGRISREAFEADPNNLRESGVLWATFEELDANNDGFIDEQDFYILWQMWREGVFRAIANNNNLWLTNNYGRQTAQWFQEHFTLQSNMERLPVLDLPIYIFHGTLDTNADVNRVAALEERLAELNRTNVTINILEGYDNELNVWRYLVYEEMPDGMQAAFDAVFYLNTVAR